MLPPQDYKVLKNNPRFEKLYNTITSSILNSDGSTKIDPSAKQRHVVRQELKAYRLKAARVHLLRSAISTAVPSQTPKPTKQEQQQLQQQQQHRRSKSRSLQHARASSSQTSPQLPPDLVQLLLLIPPFLNNASTLPPSSVSLLLSSPPFTDIATLFPGVLDLVSSRLNAQAKTLARILSPTTNPSYIHRTIPSLPSIATTLVSDFAASKTRLSHDRLAATAALTRHLQNHTEALTLLLRTLEAKHGHAAKSSELRAAEVSQEAQNWAIAAEALLWETRQLAYPPEARTALANYRQHLRDAGRRLEDGTRVREAELADYGVDVTQANINKRDKRTSLIGLRGRERSKTVDGNKERTMREMARVWREMETRLQEIQGDLKRLR
ncbi:hypothetical protein HD806DRAFT_362864 [Xylariaceae sp. AK1471]|nr:hypothetical protein HD806DRAFT_362864 [Xylariaceae sp. AK1471]